MKQRVKVPALQQSEHAIFDEEHSNDSLQIVIENPCKNPGSILDENDKRIIADLEEDLEQNLEEKAAKSNLTAINVKSILKQVITNEHVLAMVRQAENPNNEENILPFEPKCTRAKTKQLLSKSPPTPIPPWSSPKSPSEVQVLLNSELQEESDDEYVPDQTISQLETSFEDIPETPQSQIAEEDANIALRTRSKLDLNDTPLEEIERAFMPPDITTDMYDMDCDDDEWRDFLKTFTKPLDEVVKGTEDEDQDPEYNILADDDLDEVDTEELRADRAVTVSKKEFNVLIAELFEFAEINDQNQKENDKFEDNFIANDNNTTNEGKIIIDGNFLIDEEENDPNIVIKKRQIPLLAQQLRQHVQILTQNFLLTYQHPEYLNYAEIYKKNLLELKNKQENKNATMFHVINLDSALKLIEDWEKLFQTNSKQVIETKTHVDKVLVESVQARMAGLEYITTFPPLILETISNSDVFLYPTLLPRVPFKSYNIPKLMYHFFTLPEDNLIALYLEKLLPDLKNETKKRKIYLKDKCLFIHENLLNHINHKKIFRHVQSFKWSLSEENPIGFFFKYNRAPTTVHYVMPLNIFKVLPPCKRAPETLPKQWKDYIYPGQLQSNLQIPSYYGPVIIEPLYSPISKVNKLYNLNIVRSDSKYRLILPKGPVPIKPCSLYRKRKKAKRNLFSQQNKMLPDMPILSASLKENSENQREENVDENVSQNESENVEVEQCLPSTSKQGEEMPSSTTNESEVNNVAIASNSVETIESNTEKDNLDDINELMIASSTVQIKNEIRKKPGGAEKKRAKLRREFLANLVMATPEKKEIEQQKEDSIADTFLEKLKDTLEADEYNKIIDVMAKYDEKNGEFADFYKEIKSTLIPKYTELYEEFFLFLTHLQANEVGELMPYFLMKDMARFMKKLQIFFKDQPSQIKKIIKCLNELSENSDLTMDKVKTAILPLFKNNVALTEWFLQIFPFERPPNYLINDCSYEVVDLKTELARKPDEEIYETISVPDTEDAYGGANCICTCHNVENEQFRTRFQHCSKCGLKFLQGKVYVQTRKQLRPAVVSFLTNPEKDHMKRLRATERKRSENSPNKKESPNKEHTDDVNRNSYESGEDDCDGKKKAKRKRKIIKDPEKMKISNKKIKQTAKKQPNKKVKIMKKVEQSDVKVDNSVGQQKRTANDEHLSDSADILESETDCLESSQDVTNTTDSEDETKNQVNTWTREEDKIILQTFKQSDDEEETFVHIAQLLNNRTVTEIRNRFHKLMELLQEMASNSSS